MLTFINRLLLLLDVFCLSIRNVNISCHKIILVIYLSINFQVSQFQKYICRYVGRCWPRLVSAHWALSFRVAESIAIIWKTRPSWPQRNLGSSAERDSTSRQNIDWPCKETKSASYGVLFSSLGYLIAYNVEPFESLETQ